MKPVHAELKIIAGNRVKHLKMLFGNLNNRLLFAGRVKVH